MSTPLHFTYSAPHAADGALVRFFGPGAAKAPADRGGGLFWGLVRSSLRGASGPAVANLILAVSRVRAGGGTSAMHGYSAGGRGSVTNRAPAILQYLLQGLWGERGAV